MERMQHDAGTRGFARAMVVVCGLSGLTGCIYREVPPPIELGEGDVTGVTQGVPPGSVGTTVLAGVRVRVLGSSVVRSTTAQGRFVVRNLPEGTHVLELSYDPDRDGIPELGRVLRVPIRIPAGRTQRPSIDLGTVDLLPGGGLVGRVEGTAPFDDVAVNLFVGTEGENFVLTDHRAFPDPQTGVFRFDGVGVGRWEVQAARTAGTGSNRLRAEVQSAADTTLAEPLVLSVDARGTLQGVVSGPEPETTTSRQGAISQGLRLPTFTVVLQRPDGTEVLRRPFNETTDFVVPDIPAGLYNVTITADDFEPITFPFVVVAGQPSDLGSVLLSRIPVGDGIDLDGDGLIYSDDEACVAVCRADPNAVCDGRFDCDDDSDGQLDVDETGTGGTPGCDCTANGHAPALAGCVHDPLRADQDFDGICDIYDRFPRCAANRDPCAAPPDAGIPDASMPPDASVPDASVPDASIRDASVPDATVVVMDAGTMDAAMPDAAVVDAGPPDAGPPDAGTPDAATSPFGADLRAYALAQFADAGSLDQQSRGYDGPLLALADGYVALVQPRGRRVVFPGSTSCAPVEPSGVELVVVRAGVNGRCTWRTPLSPSGGGEGYFLEGVAGAQAGGRLYLALAGSLSQLNVGGADAGAVTSTALLLSLDDATGSDPRLRDLGEGAAAVYPYPGGVVVDPATGNVVVATNASSLQDYFPTHPITPRALFMQWFSPDLATARGVGAAWDVEGSAPGLLDVGALVPGAATVLVQGANGLLAVAGGQEVPTTGTNTLHVVNWGMAADGGIAPPAATGLPLHVQKLGGGDFQGFASGLRVAAVPGGGQVVTGDLLGARVINETMDGGVDVIDVPTNIPEILFAARLDGTGTLASLVTVSSEVRSGRSQGSLTGSPAPVVLRDGSTVLAVAAQRTMLVHARGVGNLSLARGAGEPDDFFGVVRLDPTGAVVSRHRLRPDAPAMELSIMGLVEAADGAVVALVRVFGSGMLVEDDCSGADIYSEPLVDGMNLVRLPVPTGVACSWVAPAADDAPAHDAQPFTGAAVITPTAATPQTVGFTIRALDEDCATLTGTEAVNGDPVRVTVAGPGGAGACPSDTLLKVYDAVEGFELYSAPEGTMCPSVSFRAYSGTDYAVCVRSWGYVEAGQSGLRAEVVPPPVNDTCASPTTVTLASGGTPVPVAAEFVSADDSYSGVSSPCGNGPGPDVFFTVIAPARGGLRYVPAPGAVTVAAAVLDGCGTLNALACGWLDANTVLPVEAGANLVVVEGFDGVLGGTFEFVPPPQADECTTAPLGATLSAANPEATIQVDSSEMALASADPQFPQDCNDGFQGPDVYFRVDVQEHGRLWVNGYYSANGYALILDGSCGATSVRACSALLGSPASTEVFPGTYLLAIASDSGSSPVVNLLLEPAVTNTSCATAAPTTTLSAADPSHSLYANNRYAPSSYTPVLRTCGTSSTQSHDVYFSVDIADAGHLVLQLYPYNAGNFSAFILDGACGSTTQRGCTPGDGSWGVPIAVNAGPHIVVVRGDQALDEGEFSLEMQLWPAENNDACVDARDVGPLSDEIRITGTTAGSTATQFSCTMPVVGHDVYYRFTPQYSGFVTINQAFSTHGGGYAYALMDDACAAEVPGSCSDGSLQFAAVSAGTSYRLAIQQDGVESGFIKDLVLWQTSGASDVCPGATDLLATHGSPSGNLRGTLDTRTGANDYDANALCGHIVSTGVDRVFAVTIPPGHTLVADFAAEGSPDQEFIVYVLDICPEVGTPACTTGYVGWGFSNVSYPNGGTTPVTVYMVLDVSVSSTNFLLNYAVQPMPLSPG